MKLNCRIQFLFVNYTCLNNCNEMKFPSNYRLFPEGTRHLTIHLNCHCHRFVVRNIYTQKIYICSKVHLTNNCHVNNVSHQYIRNRQWHKKTTTIIIYAHMECFSFGNFLVKTLENWLIHPNGTEQNSFIVKWSEEMTLWRQ